MSCRLFSLLNVVERLTNVSGVDFDAKFKLSMEPKLVTAGEDKATASLRAVDERFCF